MGYPYNDDNDDNSWGGYLSERQIRDRMNYAINGEEDDDILDYGDLDDLSEEDAEDDD